MKKAFPYLVGIAITILFYEISMTLGSFVNVITAFAAGYSSYSALVGGADASKLLLLMLFSLANHLFFAWLTSKVLMPYAIKRECAEPAYFLCTAASVVLFTLVIIPLIVSKTPGWLPIVSHSCALYFFGNKQVRSLKKETDAAHAPQRSDVPAGGYRAENREITRQAAEPSSIRFCRYCGTELKENSRFCHKCGERIE